MYVYINRNGCYIYLITYIIYTCIYIHPHLNTYIFIIIHTHFCIYFLSPDIDECSDGTHNCSQTCTNTERSFTCGCNTGFLLDTDEVTCNGMTDNIIHT